MTTYRRQAEILPAGGGPIQAVLATDAQQLDGIALQMSGANLDRFRRNPALMVGHDFTQLPPGRVEDLTVERHRLTGRLVFADDAGAQDIERRVRGGFVNALSITYLPEWAQVDREGRAWSWSLIEVSLVGVGLDAEALVTARSLTPDQRRQLLDAVQPPVDPATARRLLAACQLPAAPSSITPGRVRRALAQVIADQLAGSR